MDLLDKLKELREVIINHYRSVPDGLQQVTWRLWRR